MSFNDKVRNARHRVWLDHLETVTNLSLGIAVMVFFGGREPTVKLVWAR